MTQRYASSYVFLAKTFAGAKVQKIFDIHKKKSKIFSLEGDFCLSVVCRLFGGCLSVVSRWCPGGESVGQGGEIIIKRKKHQDESERFSK